MKKTLKLLGVSFLIAGICSTACAAEPIETSIEKEADLISTNYEEFITESVYQNESAVYTLNNMPALYHNNGQPLESDYIAENDESNLFAVYRANIDGMPYEALFFSTNDSLSKEYLLNRVANKELPTILNTSTKNINSEVYTRDGEWEFMDYDRDRLEAIINTRLTFTNEGITGDGRNSIWTVQTFNEYERVYAGALVQYNNEMSVDYDGQTLAAYSPTQDSTNGEASVNIPDFNISYTFPIEDFDLDVQSSLSNKYGRWEYSSFWGSMNNLVTEPVMVVWNNDDSLYYTVDHEIGYYRDGIVQNRTGGMYVSVPDTNF